MVGKTGVWVQGAFSVMMVLAGAFASASSEQTQTQSLTIEQRLEYLQNEIQLLKAEQSRQQAQHADTQQELDSYRQQIGSQSNVLSDNLKNRLHFGGYGELHANYIQDSEKDVFDIHRMVLYVGYDFSDWIKFHSENELEHAFVSDEDGEFSIEQAYFDFLLSEPFNVRAGRILTPVGITNLRHEPTLFNGVERPSFDKYVIPTTWFSDGVGIFGSLNPALTYQSYIVAGLDGSEFDAVNGIRDGRIKERPSLNEPAVTGRLDAYPFMESLNNSNQSLRLGLSGYFGGLDNGNQGKNPGIDGEIAIASVDAEYSVSRVDFRGAIAGTNIDGARQIGNGTAEQIFGWYLESGYHFWPEAFKVGKLADSDAVAFVRYDNFDTQYKMPEGIAANPAGDREEWTFGMNFYFTSNVVFKTDYQIQEDGNGDKQNKLNFGLGFTF